MNENNTPRAKVNDKKGETYHRNFFLKTPILIMDSYYGLLNYFTWNVGYHNEHHDFPYIAWTQLPELRKIAHEFYDPLPQVHSWCGVIWYFFFSDVNTLWDRVKREEKDKHRYNIGGLVLNT